MPTKQPASLEVLCHECGRPMPTIPAWLVGAKVKFQCNECKEKHPHPVGELDHEPRRGRAPAAAADEPKHAAPVDDAEIDADAPADADDNDEFADDDIPVEVEDTEAV